MLRAGKRKEKTVEIGAWHPIKKCAQQKKLWVPKSVSMNNKILASFFSFHKQITWIEIDPSSNSFCVDYDKMTAINSDPELDLSTLVGYGTVVFDSKAYLIGGVHFSTESSNSMAVNDIYSDKMFVHDFNSRTTIESPSRLNIPRADSTVVLLPALKLIYVFGGRTDSGFNNSMYVADKKHWGECFDLNKNDANWEFLDAESAPPDAVFEDYMPTYHFVYEKANQIVFFMLDAGFYSFNYVTKTWAPFRCILCKEARVKCFSVVVIDHLMFWQFCGVIYGYDLMKASLVLIDHLDQVEIKFESPPDFYDSWPQPSFLERVGNDTFILVMRDTYKGDKQKDLHCYKFQVQNLYAYQQGSYVNLRLLQIGGWFFHSPGDILDNVLTI